jgi:acetyl esterase/lipase
VTSEAPSATPLPDAIVAIATGYMGAKQLAAAHRAGLFAALREGPLDLPALAAATALAPRMARILADSMSALGLLTRTQGRYALRPDSARYLSGAGAGPDLGAFLRFLDGISHPHWVAAFDGTVQSGRAGALDLAGARWTSFLAGVMNYNALHAAMLAREYDFARHRRLLDFGGLAPDFAIAAMQANAQLATRFVFDPDFVAAVQERVDAAGLAARCRVEGAKTEQAQPEGAHDLVMVNHVIHRFTPEQNIEILRRARMAAAADARLLLLDFFLDDDETPRALDALHAAEYLVIDGTVVHPEAEVRFWLQSAGWHVVQRLTLPGCPRVLVAEAVPEIVLDQRRLQPEVAALLARGAADAAAAAMPLTAQALRDTLATRFEHAQTMAPVASIRDLRVAGPEGEVPVRLYLPAADQPLPVFIWLHGGGWTAGSLAENDVCCRAVAAAAQVAVLSVDYRLAPEHPYPAALDDCWAVLAWLQQAGAGLGLDAARVAVGGESAGGNLATAVCLVSRDAEGPAIRAQVLVSPVMGHPEDGYASYADYAEGYGMTAGIMHFFFAQYVRDAGQLDEPTLLPLRERDLAGLPPALLLAAECDVLRSEGERFAARLAEAGVAVEHKTYAGQVHCFFGLNTRLADAADAHRRCAAFLRRHLHGEA